MAAHGRATPHRHLLRRAGPARPCEPATPYQLKQIAQVSIFHFWSIPHTQLYTECARLAEAGLLDEEREETGRRRRIYRLTPDGRKALEDWRADPDDGPLRAARPGSAEAVLRRRPGDTRADAARAHERRLAEYEEMHGWDGMPEGMRLALEGGIGHEREYVRFWSRVLAASSERKATERVSR